jgi:succinyl-CoA synthetase beta subunit
MELMRKFGIDTPKTASATTPAEARAVYAKVIGEDNDCVIKAMVLAGGRGLGTFQSGLKGGVHVLSEPGQIEAYAGKMLGNKLITKQTGSEGLPCNRIMLAERMYMRREMYLSIMLDRSSGGPLFVASPAGGTSIEDVAHQTPNLIFRQPVDIMKGITSDQAKYLATSLGFAPGKKSHEKCTELIMKLYQMFRACDCLLLEVNPLAETPDGRVVVCDAKINFDDNAEFKQQELFALRDKSQEDPREVEVRLCPHVMLICIMY